MVRALLSDANIQGHVRALLTVLESAAWRGVWESLNLPLCTFHDLGLTPDASDALLWHACQREGIVLLTANRNDQGADSLEATIRAFNKPDSLPVLTIADAEQVLHSREYAGRVAERLLTYLIDMDNYRGTGRLYLP